MIEVAATFMALGALGGIICFSAAWANKENKKLFKKLLITSLIFALLLVIGIVMIAPEMSGGSSSAGSSSNSGCRNCGRTPIYDLGYCKSCYKSFMEYTYGKQYTICIIQSYLVQKRTPSGVLFLVLHCIPTKKQSAQTSGLLFCNQNMSSTAGSLGS